MLICLNLVTMLLLLPAMIALDVRRVFANKYDMLCCVGNSHEGKTSTPEANNAKNERTNRRGEGYEGSTKDLMGGEEGQMPESNNCAQKLTISRFARDYYGKMVAGTPMKVAVLMVAFGLLGASAWGINRLEDGLDISDIVPRNTSVWRFLEAEDR